MKHRTTSQLSKPFVSDPDTITFRDFVVGETLDISFSLTNVSFSRNTFQVKGFDPEFSGLFSVKCSPPGFISPGVSVPLSISFLPKNNSRFECNLHFLAENGPFDIKIECLPKIVNIQIEPFNYVDFGQVTFGEEKEAKFIIRNSGALPAIWSLSLNENGFDSSNITFSLIETELSFSTRQSSINGYSSSVIKMNFKPSNPCKFSCNLTLLFHSPSKSFDTFSRVLNIKAECIDVPVYLDKSSIEFGVCFYNEVYRQTLKAINRTDISQKFFISLPDQMDQFFEFTPSSGFIQPKSDINVSVKARINTDILELVVSEEDLINVPIIMNIANQVLPIEFSLLLAPSSNRILFEPTVLDFGTLCTTESSVVNLQMTSELQIPINFGFLRLPVGLIFEPFVGYGTILPGETINLSVKYSNSIPKKYEFEFSCYCMHGQKYGLKMLANIIPSPLLFSSTTILFDSTPVGEDSCTRINLSNTKSYPIEIQFSNFSTFSFDPIVSKIEPESSIPITILFRPPIPEKPMTERAEIEIPLPKTPIKKDRKPSIKTINPIKTKKSSTDSNRTQKAMIIDPDFIQQTYEENIICFWKSPTSSGRHHLDIKASSVLPSLFITSVKINNNEKRSDDMIDLNLRNIDFGIVAIGQCIDAFVEVRNMTRHQQNIMCTSEIGCFESLTPVQDTLPHQNAVFRIRFGPYQKLQYNNIAQIFSKERPNQRTTVFLKGEGSAPAISVSTDIIDFGAVLIGNTATKTLNVTNGAAFELQYYYRLIPQSSMYFKNRNDIDSFGLLTSSEWLQPDSEGQVAITFCPDHEYPLFESKLMVSAGEDGEFREIMIKASSNPYPMFILGGIDNFRPKTAFDHVLLDDSFFRPSVTCELAYPGDESSTFLQIGTSLTGDDQKRSYGEFQIDTLTGSGFTILPMKGSIEPGNSLRVQIDYNPPSSVLLQVGQWVISESQISIKCGEFAKRVPLKLKCLINLQQSTEVSQPLQPKNNTKTTTKRKSRK